MYWRADGGGTAGGGGGGTGAATGTTDCMPASLDAGAPADGPASFGICGATNGGVATVVGMGNRLLPLFGKRLTSPLEVSGLDRGHECDRGHEHTHSWYKFNCDGASKGNPGCAGAGGLIRDASGRLQIAFHDFLGSKTNTYAELFAVVRGLQLAHDEGFRMVWVEIDALVVLQIIRQDKGDWRLQALLTRLRRLCRKIKHKFSDIYREANRPADYLANKACEDQSNLVLRRVSSHLAILIQLDNIFPNFRFK
ncbi:UNVERIFIED_CONTAM: putative ribonuclease H protein [Sesamum latifolium]|uniref:Ribonuclease H protein n=1 Tax=Sesamum latifolium TaxID=2727402 RepID=A0AAW2WC42_9LAMI